MTALFKRPTRPVTPPWRGAGRLALMLALWFAGAPASAPAQAAPTAPARYYLNIEHPGQFCAGQEYSILVTPRAERQVPGPNGERTISDHAVSGVLIKAEITDTSLATISPARQTFTTIHEYGPPGQAGAVTFQLKALKAGITNLFVTAQVPPRLSDGTQRYFGPSGLPVGAGIEIQNCEYLVTATYDWGLAGPGFRYWAIGSLRTKIKATDPEYYGGEGDFSFFLNHYDFTCSYRVTYDNPNHITAHRLLDSGELELTFSMTAGDVTAACPNTYLLANSPFTDPAGPWRGVPLRFPQSGGTQQLRLVANVPGPQPPAGWVTITVQPIVGGGQ